MPPVIAAAGGFLTAITGGAIAFGAPTAAFAFGVSAAAFATSGIGSLLITGALVAGSRLISRGQSTGDAYGVNAPEVRGSIRQAVPPQRVIYGYARVGGAMFFHDDLTPPYLMWGLLLSSRRVSGIDAYHVGDNLVMFNPAGEVQTEPYIILSTAEVRLWSSFRDGDPDQAEDALIALHRPDIFSEFRQRATATAVFRAKYGADIDDFQAMWGQGVSIPNILMDVRGCGVHDPRVPTSDPDDETTWPFSNTASLIQADFLRQPYGGRLAQTKIRWDEVADAANYDDELVATASGALQKRYTIDGVINLDQNPSAIIESMLTANRGFVASNQGRVWVTSSRPRDPVLTISDDMMRGGVVYQETKRRDSLLNKVRVRFVAPDREYSTADGPIHEDTDYLADDGQTFEATLALPFTLGHERAQRISVIQLRESRAQKGITTALPVNKRTLGLRPGHVVTVESALVARMSGLYQVEAIGFSDDFGQRPVTLAEYDGTRANEYDAASDEYPFVLEDIEV